MAGKRSTSRRLSILALVAVLSVSLLAGGCKKAGVSVADLPITVSSDARVFTLFAGVNAAGYDEETGQAMDPLRVQVREALASADPKLIDPFRNMLTETTLPALALTCLTEIGEPPDFSFSAVRGILTELSGALKGLWKAQGEALFNDTSAAQAEAVNALTGPATDAVHSVLAYGHAETSPFQEVRVTVVPTASHGFAYGYFDPAKKVAYLIVGPADASQMPALVHETFYVYFGQDVFRQMELDGKLSRLNPVLEKAKAVPIISDHYYSIQGFVQESLVRALVVKVDAPADPQAALDEAYNAGFTLAPAFYEALAAFEGSDKTLIDYLPDLLAGVDVNATLARMDSQPPAATGK